MPRAVPAQPQPPAPLAVPPAVASVPSYDELRARVEALETENTSLKQRTKRLQTVNFKNWRACKYWKSVAGKARAETQVAKRAVDSHVYKYIVKAGR